ENLLVIANQVAHGSKPERFEPVAEGDELHSLYNAFNAVTGRLREDTGQLENFVTRRTSDLEAAQEIGKALLPVRDVDKLLNEAAAPLQSLFSYLPHGQVYLAAPRKEYAPLRASTIGETGVKTRRVLINNPNSRNMIGRAAQDGEPVVALDIGANKYEFLPGCRAELPFHSWSRIRSSACSICRVKTSRH